MKIHLPSQFCPKARSDNVVLLHVPELHSCPTGHRHSKKLSTTTHSNSGSHGLLGQDARERERERGGGEGGNDREYTDVCVLLKLSVPKNSILII